MLSPVAKTVFVLLLLGLGGCASADRAFRSSFSEVDLGLNGSYQNAATGEDIRAGADLKLLLRDPSKEVAPFAK